MGTTSDVTQSSSSGRGLLWLGLFCGILGPVLYVGQIYGGRLETPWYAPALATLGIVLIACALRRRRNVWRAVSLVVVVLLTAFQCWFVGYVRLPAYTGPVAAGEPFPDFRATSADGQSFTQADLKGDRDTVLIFFRGHW